VSPGGAVIAPGATIEATYIDADAREPNKVLTHPDLLSTLDLSEPVGLLLIALVHFLTDADDAYGTVATLMRALPPGSYLAMSSATQDFMTPAEVEEADAAVASGRHGSFRFRSRDEFARFFDGLELVPPGIDTIAYWRSDDEPEPRPAVREAAAYAALARLG
jgi:hypothetical protein